MSTKSRSGDLRIRGTRIRYREKGEGPPLVFLHGWSLDRRSFRRQVKFFSRTYRTIAYDSRGMGKSGGKKKPYDFTRMVDDLAEILRQLGATKPTLCGHSMGGDVALEYAATYPDEVTALVAVGAPGPKTLATSPLADEGLRLVLSGLSVFPLLPSLIAMVPVLQNLFWSERFQLSDPRAIGGWQRQFLGNSPSGLRNASRALAYREDLTHRLSRITPPTLLIVGARDQVVSREETKTYRRLIPGARLKVIKNAGHTCHEERPRAFNRTLKRFLDGVAGAPRGDGR